MGDNQNIKPTFRLGISMAGAVSAGAYTAGVMDYLLESLSKWEVAKLNKENDIPDYNVVIEVLSGASAGGMTAAITCMGLYDGIIPINSSNPQKTNNKLYDSWVNMLDDKNSDTIDKLLECEDLKEGKEVSSLLNSEVVDKIGEKTVEVKNTIIDFPKYISNDLDLIMTISNLRGVPIKFSYSNYPSAAQVTMHDGIYRFKFSQNPKTDEDWYSIDMSKDGHEIKNAAISTGAFPFGFSPRIKTVKTKFIVSYLQKKYKSEINKNAIQFTSELKNKKYQFVAVDGGMINNEPFAITYNTLIEKVNESSPVSKKIKDDYAVVMIDPFPAIPKDEQKYIPKTDLLSTAKSVLRTLRNQVIFKQDDLFKAFSDSDLTRFFIAPSRNTKNSESDSDLACGVLGGFSGFLSRSFREHDFHMGRKNCQDFLRYYLAIPVEENYSIHRNWTESMRKRFRFYREECGIKKYYLPIIPDLDVLKAEGTPPNSRSSAKKIDNPEYLRKEELLSFPNIKASSIIKYEKKLRYRISKIINGLQDSKREELRAAKSKSSIIDQKFGNYNPSKILLIGWLSKIAYRQGIKWLSKRLSKMLLTTLVEEGIKSGIIEDK